MRVVKRRRLKGEGGVHKWRGYLVAEIELPRLSDGKRRRKKIYAKTAAELAEKRKAYEIDQGLAPDLGKLTAGELLDRWLESSAKVKNRAHTIESSYEPIVRLHLRPALGHRKAKQCTSAHAQAIIKEKSKTLSARTVRNIRAVLRKAWGWAKGKGYVTANIADDLDMPPPQRPKYRTLSAAEAQAFLDALAGHRLEPFYWTLLLMGMREAELIGQKIQDVNLDAGTMRVRVQIQRVKGKFIETPTKSGSDTVLTLPSILVPVLQAHLDRLSEEATLVGWKEQGLLFPNERGGPFHAKSIYDQFKAALVRAQIDPKGIRVHDLRHTCASLMISQGAHLSVIKERLRHSQISVTADTYGHVFEETQRAAAEMLGGLFVAPEAVPLELPKRKTKA
jgi:integrase